MQYAEIRPLSILGPIELPGRRWYIVAARTAGKAKAMTSHAIFHVCGVHIGAPYTLRVAFDDGTEQVIDFRPICTTGPSTLKP